MPTIRLTELLCLDTQDFTGPDEIVLFVFKDGNYEGYQFRQLLAGETWNVNWEIEFQNEVQVYLTEYDGPQSRDILGQVTINNGDSGSERIERLGASYNLSWAGNDTGDDPTGATQQIMVRSNEASLSRDQRTRFVTAYNACIQNGALGRLVLTHGNMMHRHHGTMSGAIAYRRFLPWHRAYLLQLEEALQEIDPEVSIPYWRWTTSRRLPDWLGALQTVVLMPNGSTLQITDNPRSGSQLPTSGVVQQILRSTTYFNFSQALEGGPHNAVHMWTGGVMAQIPQAPAHPVFWMHHAECDRIWEIWRNGPNNQDPTLTGTDDVLDPFNERASTVLDIRALGYEYD